MLRPRTILLSTFEPSGDALAAGVVRKLLKQQPELEIYAMGGQKLADAGATLIEQTTQRATMGLAALKQIQTHRQRLKRLKNWLRSHPIDMLVPVDSPAANWSICRTVRENLPAARIVHLVAPQLWAWGSWRVGRMHRWSDHALCLLPFEPDWFHERQVSASFVGHPVFDPDCHAPGSDHVAANLPQSPLRLVLLPGSRMGEIHANAPTMLRAFAQLKQRHPQLTGIVGALNDALADVIRQMASELKLDYLWEQNLQMSIGETESVLKWADLALAASGTVTLQIASHHTPMVAMYNASWWQWQLIGRWLIHTRRFTLPNLIGHWQHGKDVIVEFAPHFRQVKPIVEAVSVLLEDEAARQTQAAQLEKVLEPFEGKVFSDCAAEALLQWLNRERPAPG